MATYRLTSPAFVAANGSPRSRHFQAGTIISYDGVPSGTMFAMDAEAVAAVEARKAEQPFRIARNGVQALNADDTVRVPAFVPHGPSALK